jgi:predicted glycoside hydrolase/deacetylase ChbG (UPF0249 family)
VDATRYLVVTADDYGIGPETSRGILDLAARGLVTSTVLLVNSPHAEESVRLWRRREVPLEMGWHPCLTLDRPILPAGRVPSLVRPDGRFWPLGALVRRLALGRVRPADIEAELRAQYHRFLDLVGRPPAAVNSHHHVQVFPPVGAVLLRVLIGQRPRPYVRRVREPWPMLARVPGARLKRGFLSLIGRWNAAAQRRAGFPGNDWLAGITDPPCVADPDYLTRWLARVPGRVVELTCHPGHLDVSLDGRDGSLQDGHLLRRVHELQHLEHDSFRTCCRAAGFALVPALAVIKVLTGGERHAA